MSDEWIPLADAARTIRRDPRTLRRWAAAGLRTITVNDTRYVRLAEARKWALENGRPRGRQ